MGELTKKQLRIINRALDGFFSIRALKAPRTIEDFKVPNVLSRELRLDGSRVFLMTDLGLSHLKTIVTTLNEVDILDGATSYSDLYSACVKVFERCLSRNQRPDNGGELASLVRADLERLVDQRTFAVPILGIKLVDIEVLHLGCFKIVPASLDVLATAGVEDADDRVASVIKQTKTKYWLVGSVRGTARVAEEKFQAQANLVVGMLAVCAASMYQHGAHGFRIGVVMSPVEAYGPSAWLSWTERKRTLTTHHKFLSKQDFEVSQELVKQLQDEDILNVACRFFQDETRTPLEEAITKAVYWYSEAHRESVPVMKLVKYWSAVEIFFSISQAEITRSVSAGLAAVLVFGGFAFVPLADYIKTKRRIADLYTARSKAVHRASHSHVSELDAAELSQWVAWMLINMVAFQMRGYTTVEKIKEHSDRLDARMMKAS